MVGKTIIHYKILEKIGQGGMDEVYLAEDSRLDRNDGRGCSRMIGKKQVLCAVLFLLSILSLSPAWMWAQGGGSTTTDEDNAEQIRKSREGLAMEYSDPATGGPVLRTMTCWVQLIRPGVRTKAHRHTSSKVYQVFKGEGYSVIDGKRFDWTEGDFLVVPSWAWHEHAASEGQEAVLFSIQDTPIMKSMALYREEPYTENAGHQPVTSRFAAGSPA